MSLKVRGRNVSFEVNFSAIEEHRVENLLHLPVVFFDRVSFPDISFTAYVFYLQKLFSFR